ncbi:MAG TPA: glycoside hydrolase family 16 protein [Anaerolineales bacterium]|nr:glycoside hydrolase family 16 protein [Anaerolineales bacterium]
MSSINEPPRLDESETIFFDDFSLDALDRSKWNVEITGSIFNNEQQAYVDSAETIYIEKSDHTAGEANGVLVIHPRHCPGFVTPEGKTFDFISGRLNTLGKVEFTYGSIAARMKLPAGAGLWPAFWAMGSSKPWPENGEIDIMENVGEPDWTNVAMHGPGYSGDTPLVNRKYFSGKEDATAWHVYSVDWMVDCLLFKTDGELTYRVTRAMVEQFGPWVYDNSKFMLLNCALGGAYPVTVNKVQFPYLGLPESTVQMIKDDNARILIDWVRVTKL